MLYSRWIVLAAPFQPSRAEPEPVADECGFSNALSLLLARDWKVALEEVIRSQWSLSERWNKCSNNQLMNSSLRRVSSSADSASFRCANVKCEQRVTHIWQITLTRIIERRNESCCQVCALRIAENAAELTGNSHVVFPTVRNHEQIVLWEHQTLEICMAIKLTFGHQPFGPGFNVFIVFVVCSSKSSSLDLVNVLLRQV